ncbi:response regulator [Modestobacter sp. SYSU DS0875]
MTGAPEGPSPRTRVVIADDEAMVRAGVRAILSSEPAIEVVAEAADGRTAIDLVRTHRPDVAVLDVRMPGLDGLTAAIEIHTVSPATAVVVLTTFGEDAYIARALDAGASGFLLKASDPRELIAAVRAAAVGAAYLSPAVTGKVSAALRRSHLSPGAAAARARISALTDREREVLSLIGVGLSNAEIAARLYVVEGTVKGYVSAILTRLDVRNRVQAAILAHEAGLVPPDGLAAP